MRSFRPYQVAMSCAAVLVIASNVTAQRPENRGITKPLVELSGRQSGIFKPAFERITSQQDWDKVWNEHTRLTSQDYLAMKLDFDKVMVIAVFSGKDNDVGYELDSIREDSRRLTMRVKHHYPQYVSGTFKPADWKDPIRSPWAIYVLPRTEKEMVLEYGENHGSIQSPSYRWTKWAIFPAIPSGKKP